MSRKCRFLSDRYLQLPGARPWKLQVDNSSRVGNIQQFFEALSFANSPTLENRPQEHLKCDFSHIQSSGHRVMWKIHTEGVTEFDLWRRSTQRHGDFPEAGVKGHLPLVLLGTIVVRGQQVDLHSLNCLLHPFQNLEVEGAAQESRYRSLNDVITSFARFTICA